MNSPRALSTPLLLASVLAAATATHGTAQVDRDVAFPVESRKLLNATYGDILGHAVAGFRVSNVEIASVSPLRFDGTVIKNAGEYQRTWSFVFDKTYNEVVQTIFAGNWRPVDVEPYTRNGQELWAVLLFKNSGRQRKNWNWFRAIERTSILTEVASVGGRPIDLEPYETPAGQRYSVLSIENSGRDQKTWWLYSDTTASSVQQHLAQHGSRVYDYEQRSMRPTRASVVLVRDNFPSKTLWGQYYAPGFDTDEDLIGRVSSIGRNGLFDVVTIVDALDPFEIYGTSSLGTNGPTRHDATGTAMTGSEIVYTAENLRPGAPVSISAGLSRATMSLAGFGAPGCALYTMPVFALGLTADANGEIALPVQVPVVPAAHGAKFQSQVVAIDNGINALNVQTSNGLETTLRHW